MTAIAPISVLFARPALAVIAEGLVALLYALRSSPTAWHDSQRWLPVYGTLVDAGCLTLLWQLTRREGRTLVDLIGLARTRVRHDVLLGIILIVPSLVIIFASTYTAGWLIYGAPSQPYSFGALPLPAALYGALIWPLIWGLAEQMTYNGYLLPRFEVLCRSRSIAVAVVASAWALQHAFMPLTFEPRFMTFRALSALPYALFLTMSYLGLRRLLPLVITHALLDGASVWMSALLPLLRS